MDEPRYRSRELLAAKTGTESASGPPPLVERAGDRDDELLAHPPDGDHHRGRFAGYTAAARVRRRIVLTLLAVTLVGFGVCVHHLRELEYERLHPFVLPPAKPGEVRSREMWWTDGRARLGLSREAPGLEVIHLPDRDLRLAEGCDHAQFYVEIRDGRTERIRMISGELLEVAREDAATNQD